MGGRSTKLIVVENRRDGSGEMVMMEGRKRWSDGEGGGGCGK